MSAQSASCLAYRGQAQSLVVATTLLARCHVFGPPSAVQAQAAGVMSGGSSGGKKAAESNEVWWDVAGWVTLGAIIVGVMMFSRGSQQAAVKSA